MQIGKYNITFKRAPAEQAPEVAKSVEGEVAWSESLLYSGSDWPKYNPDELLTRKGAVIYRKMMTDEQVKSVVRFKRGAVTSREFIFETEDDAELEARAEVLKEMLQRVEGSFTSTLNGIMTSSYEGFSLSEKVFGPVELSDGKMYHAPLRIPLRPAHSFKFGVDEYGNVDELVQTWENQEQALDYSRFIHHVHNQELDRHYGRSELVDAYRSWFSKDMIIRFSNIYMERMASGFIWATPKDGVAIKIDSPDYVKIQNMLSNITVKTAMLLPSGLELHVEKPNNTDIFERMIAVHDKAIAKALLVPNLLGITEQGNTGSYSQSQTQLDAFLFTIEDEVKRLEETINEQLLRDIAERNWSDKKFPRFKFKPLSKQHLYELIRVWKDLVQAGGATHSDTDEGWVREQLGIPELGEPVVKSSPIMPGLLPGRDPSQQQGDGQQQDQQPQDTKQQPPTDKATEQKKPTQQEKFAQAKAKAIKRVAFSVIEHKTDNLTSLSARKIGDAVKAAADIVKEYIKEHGVNQSPEKAQDVGIPARAISKIRKAYETALKEAWGIGTDHAQNEVTRAEKKFAALPLNTAAAQKYLEAQSFRLAGDLTDAVNKKVQTIVYNGIKGTWSLEEVYARIDDEVEGVLTSNVMSGVRTSVFDAVNEARFSFFTDPDLGDFVEALEYSAILDGKTTDICQELDGHIHAVDSEVWQYFKPPNHFNCRSLLVAVTKMDTWEESPYPTVQPADGFGG